MTNEDDGHETFPEPTPESHPDAFIPVRVDHFNSLMSAAELGFAVLVKKRDALKSIHAILPQYPNRDRDKMDTDTVGLVGTDIGISRDDVAMILRDTERLLSEAAAALNERTKKAGRVSPRFK